MATESAEFPGRQPRNRKDGSVVYYWIAQPKAIAAGFQPKTERLDYPEGADQMSRRCIELQAQMHRWLADPTREDRFDARRVKTIRELIRLYTSDPESPYRELAHTTRKSYDWQLQQIDKAVGERVIAYLAGKDFRRWYDQFKRPNKRDDPERVSKAHHLIKMLRALFTFGVLWRVPEAAVVRDILAKMDFPDAPPRDEYLTYEMAVAFIDKALELGELAMALSQALQFELTLRQTDVIGKWTPKPDNPATLEWGSGLLWQHIHRPDFIVEYTPGKTKETTGQKVTFDLKDYELVMKVLGCFPVIPEIGPIIINQHTGLPFTYVAYHTRWCKIAELTGLIPKSIWNRDSRAGGVTEGGEAGADLEDLAQHAGHADLQTTRRYNRKTLAKTKRVAKLRKAHRNAT